PIERARLFRARRPAEPVNRHLQRMAMRIEPPTESKPGSPPPQFASDPNQATIIGRSKQNRPIACVWRGRGGAALRVLILAGQHGDERSARRTIQSLLALPAEEVAARLPTVQLAIVPEANPDGCVARSRCNADG